MRPSFRLGCASFGLAVSFGLTGCEVPKSLENQAQPSVSADTPDPLPELRVFEAKRRHGLDFAALPPSDARLGADPYAIASLGKSERFVAILRGRDALVVLDADGRELTRLAAPASPTGLSVASDGNFVFVVGELSGDVQRYEVLAEPPYVRPRGRYVLEGVAALRDVEAGPQGALYVVEERKGRLITLFPEHSAKADEGEVLSARREDVVVGHGPLDVSVVGKFVLVLNVLDHAVVIHAVDEAGHVLPKETRIERDGPIWSYVATPETDGLLVITGGVEDHPLDRREGFFGYIDSFVSSYRVAGDKPTLLGEVNVSTLGVVTPKALSLDATNPQDRSVLVTGYGGEKRTRLRLEASGMLTLKGASIAPFFAGTRSLARFGPAGFVAANPLLDAFVVVREESATGDVIAVADPSPKAAQSQESRLGEALFFTNLMAPDNKTEGAHSRFTCETCHFEGYVDGRIHHTGRGDVRVVTKPLLGLFNNRPHFSRALDPDLSSVAHNEFRVAGAGNDVSPWFSLDPKVHPTFAALFGADAQPAEPLELRRALMSFLMDFTHRTNPAVVGRTSFTAEEREGSAVFRARCEGCHEARLAADEPTTRVPFERWESFLFTLSGAPVWAMNEYRKTGVTPYVHDNGARVPSLRRLAKKYPYLTSGSAKSLDDLLGRVRWTNAGAFFHDNAPATEKTESLSGHERETLRAFLELL